MIIPLTHGDSTIQYAFLDVESKLPAVGAKAKDIPPQEAKGASMEENSTDEIGVDVSVGGDAVAAVVAGAAKGGDTSGVVVSPSGDDPSKVEVKDPCDVEVKNAGGVKHLLPAAKSTGVATRTAKKAKK